MSKAASTTITDPKKAAFVNVPVYVVSQPGCGVWLADVPLCILDGGARCDFVYLNILKHSEVEKVSAEISSVKFVDTQGNVHSYGLQGTLVRFQCRFPTFYMVYTPEMHLCGRVRVLENALQELWCCASDSLSQLVRMRDMSLPCCSWPATPLLSQPSSVPWCAVAR